MVKKMIRAMAAVLLVAVSISGCSPSAESVATIAGEKITKDEYTFFNSAVKRRIESAAKIDSMDEAKRDKFWADKVDGQDPMDKFQVKDRTLEELKQYKILLIKAKESKTELTEQQKKDRDANIEKSLEQFGSKDEIPKNVEKYYGINVDSYKNITENLSLIGKYIETERGKIQVPDEEIKKYYEDESTPKPELYKAEVQHILFMTADQGTQQSFSQEKINAQRKKAEEVLAKAKAGEDFTALVKQYTEDTASKDSGGAYTVEKNGKYVEAFENWALTAKPGEIDIVETNFGYHVMKSNKKEKLTLDATKDKIKDVLVNKKFNDQMDALEKDKNYEIKDLKI